MDAQDLHLGASHADMVGRVVIVDVDSDVGGRYLVTGVLTNARDQYGRNGDVVETMLMVGGERVRLVWERDDTLTAQIEAL